MVDFVIHIDFCFGSIKESVAIIVKMDFFQWSRLAQQFDLIESGSRFKIGRRLFVRPLALCVLWIIEGAKLSVVDGSRHIDCKYVTTRITISNEIVHDYIELSPCTHLSFERHTDSIFGLAIMKRALFIKKHTSPELKTCAICKSFNKHTTKHFKKSIIMVLMGFPSSRTDHRCQ